MEGTAIRALPKTPFSKKVQALLADCGMGVLLSFLWTGTEAAIIWVWPGFMVVRIFVSLVAYAVLPLTAVRRMKGLYPHGVGLLPVVLTSFVMVVAMVGGREALFELLRRLVPDQPISILAPYSVIDPLLPLVVFYFSTRSFQEGAEFSARSDIIERYGPMR